MSDCSPTKVYMNGGTTFSDFRTENPRMRRAIADLKLYAKDDAPILILGETGTGKTLLALAVHNASGRKGHYIDALLPGVPDGHLWSHLFGHVKGAFSGATSDRRGLLRDAAPGTVLIDEVGCLALAEQERLLHVVEYRRVLPLGADRPEPCDVRLVFATNVPYETLLSDETRWRRDFLFRLGKAVVEFPPLRARKEDLPALATAATRYWCALREMEEVEIPRETMETLLARTWWGNVRELRSDIRVAVARCDGRVLRPEDFLPETPIPHVSPEELSLDEQIERIVERAIEAEGGNVSAAARRLKTSRNRLDRWRRGVGDDGEE